MKVALVHDYIKEYGGAERVLEALHELYPNAPVFTSVYLPKFLGPHAERFKDWDIRTSSLQHLPFIDKLISPTRLLSANLFKRFDLSGFDVVIVSATGAYFPNALSKKSAKQICYCHTPPRYLYGYATAREWKKNKLLNVVGELVNHFLRMVDVEVSRQVDYYIANSQEVAGRIEKFYRRDSTVIYPPIDVEQAKSSTQSDKKSVDYYVAGGRLARPKHIDLIIKACQELKVPLKVFGKGFAGHEEELQALAKGKTEFVGEVSDEEKWELLKNAKAYLFASEDEDFGILPVEAMAVGTPVIAYKSGGVQETVIDGKTGLFFEELTIESLMKAIKQFEKLKFDSKESIKQAGKFGKERFQKEIKAFVEKVLQEKPQK